MRTTLPIESSPAPEDVPFIPEILVPRRWVVAATAAIAILLALLGQGLWSTVAVALVLTAVLVPGRAPRGGGVTNLLGWLPVGFVVLVALVSLAAVGAGLLHISLWSPDAALITWITFIALCAAAGLTRSGHIRLWSPQSLLAWLPAAAFAATQAYRFAQPVAYWSRPVWHATDWVNHAEMLADLRAKGFLDYWLPTPASVDIPVIYPRALHALLAWVLEATTSPASLMEAWEHTFQALMVAGSATTVLAIAASSTLTIVAARRMGASPVAVVVAVLVTSAAFIYPLWLGVVLWSGFLTTAAIVVLLFALVVVAATDSETGGARAAIALLMALAAFNLWQLMALPVLLAAGYQCVTWWRGDRDHPAAVVTAGTLMVAGCLPLGLVTLDGLGLAQAGVAGNFAAFSIGFTLVCCGVAVGVVLADRQRHLGDGLRVVFSGIVLLSLGMAVVLVGYTGNSFSDIGYYPGKVLWHSVVLAFPVFVPATMYLVVRAWHSHWMARVSGGRGLTKAAMVGVPAVLVLAYVGGSLSYVLPTSVHALASPAGANPQVALAVLQDPQLLGAPGQPVLVWGLHPRGWGIARRYDDWHASQIIRQIGHPVPEATALLAHRADDVCAWLASNPTAVRITGTGKDQWSLVERGCPLAVVKPDSWIVVSTPAEWWRGTDWESTGGAPDPGGEVRDDPWSQLSVG